MSDRVPIGTHPGAATGLVGQDLIVHPAAAVPFVVVRLFVRRTDNYTGALIADLRNATGGSGSGITCTIAAGQASGVATGSLQVSAGQSLYLRVTTGPATSMNVSGWFEVEGALAATAALTTLTRVKDEENITDGTYDALLSNLIAGVSEKMQGHIGRRILLTAVSAERYDVEACTDCLVLRSFPVYSAVAPVVTEDGVALVLGTDFEVGYEEGLLFRISSGKPSDWLSGRRIVAASYTHGWAATPADLEQAATDQVRHQFHQTAKNAARLGLQRTVLETGATSAYLPESLLPSVLETLEAYRPRRVGAV